MSDLQAQIEKIPMSLLLGAFLAMLAFDAYTFVYDPTSDLGLKMSEHSSNESAIVSNKQRLKEATDFFNKLELKVAEIRALQSEFEKMKSTLSNELDIPSFIKMVVTEATRVGLRVKSIKPTDLKTTELYAEQSFEMTYEGVFAQLMVFMDRISKLERIVRLENFDIKREGSATATYVQVSGKLQLKAYRYVDAPVAPAAAADAAAKPAAAATASAPATAAAPAAAAPAGGEGH